MADLEVVLDREVLFGGAFTHNVLQYSCAGSVRDIVVQREGEGEVCLSIGLDVNVLFHSAPDRIVIDWIYKL